MPSAATPAIHRRRHHGAGSSAVLAGAEEGAAGSGPAAGAFAPRRSQEGSSIFIPLRGLLAVCELTQHVLQDAPVDEVLLLFRRIDAHDRLEGLLLAVGVDGRDRDFLRARETEAFDAVRLFTREPQARGRVAVELLQRHDTHADQVRPVDAFVAFREHGLDSQQRRAFRRPVA